MLQLVPPTADVVQPARADDAEAKSVAEVGDEKLVALVLVGDRDAFEALYRRHARFAVNLAIRLQGNRTDIEDLVHDAFLKAHQRLSELRDPSAFRGWLGSIVVSQVRTRLRRARWFRGLGLSTVFGPAINSHDSVQIESIAATSAAPDVRAELAQVYALLRLLPAEDRIAWTLRSVERHQLEEVAELTRCSLATVKRRVQRAQRFLDGHFVSSQPNDGGSGDRTTYDDSRAELATEEAEAPPMTRRRTRRGALARGATAPGPTAEHDDD